MHQELPQLLELLAQHWLDLMAHMMRSLVAVALDLWVRLMMKLVRSLPALEAAPAPQGATPSVGPATHPPHSLLGWV